MAKVLGPLHSDRVKGSISGFTFREYRGQASVSRRARPVERASTVLSNNRSIFSFLSRHWGRVTAANRLLWAAYAAAHPRPNGMGGTFQLDGNQMFMSLNHTAIRIGGIAKYADQPPITEIDAAIDTLTAIEGANAGEIQVDWTFAGTEDAGDFNEVQYAGPFDSPGRVAVSNRFKYVADVAGNIKTYTLTGLQAGAWYLLRVRYIGVEGVVSNWVYDQSTAKA